MIPLNRTSVVVRPTLPFINWVRSVVDEPISLDDLRSSVYLVSLEAAGDPVDPVVAHYWERIFECELVAWTPDESQWPKQRDLATFRRWFDVELHHPVVDLGSDDIYFDPEDYGLDLDELFDEDELDEEVLELFGDGWTGNEAEEFDRELFEAHVEPPPYPELFPPDPYEVRDDPSFPEAGPTKGLIHQYKITLHGIEPPIWRRIQVPAGYSFWDLHVAIADAMGWMDSHLHLFSVPNPADGSRHPIGIEDPEENGLPDHETAVAAYFKKEGDSAWYTYDYGDMWVHEVVLESILPREKGQRYPKCLDGARACPPEDAGGAFGYIRMLKILDSPSHPEHPDIKNWLGDFFDPEEFSPKNVDFDDPKKRRQRALRNRG